MNNTAFKRLRPVITLLSILISCCLALLCLMRVPEFTNYKYFKETFLAISLFFFSTILIFSFKFQVLAYGNIIAKSVIPILCIPIIFILISNVSSIQGGLDDEGYEHLFGHLNLSTEVAANKGLYARNLAVFFGIGSCISLSALTIRILINIWRNINRGTA